MRAAESILACGLGFHICRRSVSRPLNAAPKTYFAMHIIEGVTVSVAGERRTSMAFRLRHDYVFVVDLCNHAFSRDGDKVVVNVRMRNDSNDTYLFKFERGRETISLVGQKRIIFSGFEDNDDGNDGSGNVKPYRLYGASNDTDSDDHAFNNNRSSANSSCREENNVIAVSVHLANKKKKKCFFPSACNSIRCGLSGGGGGEDKSGRSDDRDSRNVAPLLIVAAHDNKENLDIDYPITDDYYEGHFCLRFYILMYTRHRFRSNNGGGGGGVCMF